MLVICITEVEDERERKKERDGLVFWTTGGFLKLIWRFIKSA